MFCPNCGTRLSDDAAFCSECGQSIAQATPAAAAPQPPVVEQPVVEQPVVEQPVVEQPVVEQPAVTYAPPPAEPQVTYTQQPAPATPVYAPVNPAEQSPIVRDTTEYIKGFFSNKMLDTASVAAKKTGLQWLIFSMSSILFVALALAACLSESGLGYMYSYGILFLRTLVVAAGAYFALSSFVFVAVKNVFKKQMQYTEALNLTAYALIPVAVAALPALLFAFVYVEIAYVIIATATIMTFGILYNELKKAANSEFVAFLTAIVIVAAMALATMFLDLIMAELLKNATRYSSYGSGYGGGYDLGDLFDF